MDTNGVEGKDIGRVLALHACKYDDLSYVAARVARGTTLALAKKGASDYHKNSAS